MAVSIRKKVGEMNNGVRPAAAAAATRILGARSVVSRKMKGGVTEVQWAWRGLRRNALMMSYMVDIAAGITMIEVRRILRRSPISVTR